VVTGVFQLKHITTDSAKNMLTNMQAGEQQFQHDTGDPDADCDGLCVSDGADPTDPGTGGALRVRRSAWRSGSSSSTRPARSAPKVEAMAGYLGR